MNIRKFTDDFSRDLELIYNSDNTRKNYLSQVVSFLNYFKDEIEPKAISNDKIKDWLLQAQAPGNDLILKSNFFKPHLWCPNHKFGWKAEQTCYGIFYALLIPMSGVVFRNG